MSRGASGLWGPSHATVRSTRAHGAYGRGTLADTDKEP